MSDEALRPILVVDDDEAILTSVEMFLSDEGYPIAVADNGKDALELASSASPRLIILDLKMPGMDGWAFVAAYRKQVASCAPIIAMTAAHDSGWQATEVADAYVAKPFDLDQLLELVRRYAGS